MIKVLHLFPPNPKTRFSGPAFRWRFTFFHWEYPGVVHHVLDDQINQLIPAQEAFRFEYSSKQEMTSRFKRALWILSLFRGLIQYKGEYDIIHVHILWWGSLLLAPWAKWNGIPAVYESVLLDSDTPGGILEESLGMAKVRCLKNYRAILAISDGLAEDYLQHGFAREQVFKLMNCVDLDLFAPPRSDEAKSSLRHKYNLPKNATVLVFVGSVIVRKGVDVLIRAFIEACSRCSNLYLLIIGPNKKNENPSLDKDFIDGLYSLLKQNNLSEQVSFRGLIQDREQLAEMYCASDIFVFPSNNEGLPNVVLEAMACELPVVVSHLPVLEKVINHMENGLFTPIGDVGAIRDSILRLSEDSSLAGRIGQNARHYVQQNHSFMEWQTQLVGFYQGLLPDSVKG